MVLKAFSVLMLLGVFVYECSGQVLESEKIDSSQVNSFVIKSYHAEFGEVDSVKWYKVGGLSYRADFKLLSDSLSVLYRADGKVLYKRKLITQNQLPEGLLQFVKEDNKGYPITKIYHESDRNKTVYVFYLDTGDRYKEVKLEY